MGLSRIKFDSGFLFHSDRYGVLGRLVSSFHGGPYEIPLPYVIVAVQDHEIVIDGVDWNEVDQKKVLSKMREIVGHYPYLVGTLEFDVLGRFIIENGALHEQLDS